LGLPTHFGEMLRRFIRRFGGGFRRRLKRPRSRLRLPVEARRHGAADSFEAGERDESLARTGCGAPELDLKGPETEPRAPPA
jgi:hypothetical protein